MTKETILVVDDSQEIRHFLRDKLLAVLGYRVLTAMDGLAGITIAEQEKPDLILLDINLPKMSGVDVLQAFQEKKSTIPVIMITSEAEPSMILACFRLGAKDYLQKPFTAADVTIAIDKVLSESRWIQEREEMTATITEVNHKLQRRIRAWEVLNQVGQSITATLNENDAQRELMRGLNKLMQVEAGALFLIDESTGELVLRVSMQGDIEKRTEVRLKPGQGIAGWVFQHGQPVLVPDTLKDNRFYSGVDQQHTGFLTRSVLATPLIIGGKTIGVIEVLNPVGEKSRFEQIDVETLGVLASSAAVALENVQLYDQMRSSVTLETLKNTVATLAHYINNSLTVILMVANFLKEKVEKFPSELRPDWLSKSASTLKKETQRIAHVLSVLNQITDVKEEQYLGDSSMLDISEALKSALGETQREK